MAEKVRKNGSASPPPFLCAILEKPQGGSNTPPPAGRELNLEWALPKLALDSLRPGTGSLQHKKLQGWALRLVMSPLRPDMSHSGLISTPQSSRGSFWSENVPDILC